MSAKTDVLKTPSGGRYDRGWCEPAPQKPKQCVDNSVKIPQRLPKNPERKDRFVNVWNPPISKEIQKKMEDPAWRASQVAQLRAAGKQAWYEEFASNLTIAERWKSWPWNTVKAPFIAVVAVGAAIISAFGAGCVFDTSGLPDRDGQVTPDSRVDTGVPDSALPDSGRLDGDIPDAAIQMDTGTPDADANVPLGEPPVITKPTLTGGPNNLVRVEWNAPQTTPNWETITGYQMIWSDGVNPSDSRTINNPNIRNMGIRVTTPNATYTFAVRAVYDNGASHSDWSSLAGFQTDDSCVALYPMDWGQGDILYDAVGTNDGTLVGFDPTNNYDAAWVPGISGKGLLFNGATTYVDMGNAFNFDSTDAFTVEAWVQRSSVGNTRFILGKEDLSNASLRGYWFGYLDTGAIRLNLIHEQTTSDMLRIMTVNQYIVPNVPQHIAATYDGSLNAAGVGVYVNGIPEPIIVDVDGLAGTIVNGMTSRIGAGMLVGGSFEDVDFVMHGIIDDLAVYNRDLTPDEIINNTCAREALYREENNDTTPLPVICN